MINEIGLRVARAIGWLGQMLALLLLCYAAAGLIGGSIPANAGWKPPARGIRILIEDNGVHTGLVLPAIAAGVDWRATFPPGDIADARFARLPWIAVGWGDRSFYAETPTWRDARIGNILRAAIGSTRTVLHVEHVAEPALADNVREIVLSEDEYRRLADYVRATIGPGGKVASGYGANDVFYDGRGRYSAVNTCNEWTGRALRTAGVRTGLWTPFPVTVTTWF